MDTLQRLPRHVVLDSPLELRILRAWVASPFMPVFDIDMLFQTLYSSLTARDNLYQQALYRLAAEMAHTDYLLEKNTLDMLMQDELEQLIISAGHAISRQLNQLKLYHPMGELLYRFRGYRNDSTLLFELAPSPSR